MSVDTVTDDLFRLIRKCYNLGTDSMRKSILNNCVGILLDSIAKESDRKALFDTYNSIKKSH